MIENTIEIHEWRAQCDGNRLIREENGEPVGTDVPGFMALANGRGTMRLKAAKDEAEWEWVPFLPFALDLIGRIHDGDRVVGLIVAVRRPDGTEKGKELPLANVAQRGAMTEILDALGEFVSDVRTFQRWVEQAA